jgi:hypothetical protein
LPDNGPGAISVSGASCYVFTPAAAGALAAGVNADENDYALVPAAGATGHLVVFLNGSFGHPAGVIVDPVNNVYTAAIAAGDHILGVSYRSDDSIGMLCNNDDACFLPTRLTVVTGSAQTGAADEVADITQTEGIHSRVALALAYLATADPAGGWSQFINAQVDPSVHPGASVHWRSVIVAGHSQGGGHAALLAKLHSVARLVTLSAPCDNFGGTAASWLLPDTTWRTSPAAFGYGFAAETTFNSNGTPIGGDTTCAYHAVAWSALGYDPARTFDDAIICAGQNGHSSTIKCPQNMARVQSLFQL